MQIKVLAFSVAKDVMGFSEQVITVDAGDTVEAILERLQPGAKNQLATSRVSLDGEFVAWETPVRQHQELAIIPPVSGG